MKINGARLNMKPEWLYLWEKRTTDKIFIAYVVSDDANKYPYNGEQDGFLYYRVEQTKPGEILIRNSEPPFGSYNLCDKGTILRQSSYKDVNDMFPVTLTSYWDDFTTEVPWSNSTATACAFFNKQCIVASANGYLYVTTTSHPRDWEGAVEIPIGIVVSEMIAFNEALYIISKYGTVLKTTDLINFNEDAKFNTTISSIGHNSKYIWLTTTNNTYYVLDNGVWKTLAFPFSVSCSKSRMAYLEKTDEYIFACQATSSYNVKIYSSSDLINWTDSQKYASIREWLQEEITPSDVLVDIVGGTGDDERVLLAFRNGQIYGRYDTDVHETDYRLPSEIYNLTYYQGTFFAYGNPSGDVYETVNSTRVRWAISERKPNRSYKRNIYFFDNGYFLALGKRDDKEAIYATGFYGLKVPVYLKEAYLKYKND